MEHYTEEDRKRLAPARERVKMRMLGAGWLDLDTVSHDLNLRFGTVASKLRELCDSDHSFNGLAYERRSLGRGVHEYRLFVREPGQMPLFEAAA